MSQDTLIDKTGRPYSVVNFIRARPFASDHGDNLRYDRSFQEPGCGQLP
jgi:hypothetical protein